jgi:hypothetical protein
MTSLSVDNKVQEETAKSLPRRHERGKANGKKEEKKKLKGDKENTKIKAKGKCKSSGKFSLLHSTQRNLLL